MSRVQLALNVADLDSAIDFYRTLFKTDPAKVRPGYANFAIEDPPLKLVLIEGSGQGGSLNHLGVEVVDSATVVDSTRRLHGDGLAVEVEDGVECCYALQDKVWVHGPDGEPWEIYTVLKDAEVLGCGPGVKTDVAQTCCGPLQEEEAPFTTARQNCCG